MFRRSLRLASAIVLVHTIPLSAHIQQQKLPDASDVFRRSSPAVVTITTASGFGSGVLIDATGVIVTNLHVVQSATKVAVKLSNGDVYDDVAAVDFDARKDLVLLKIKGFKLPVVELGDSDSVSVGNPVYAIGAPQGLELTISQGIVSGLRDSGDGYRVVQTTAAISPGSSGGGLFDETGRLVAITTYRIKGGENLNFAIPVNYVRGMAATTAQFTLEELKSKLGSAVNQTGLSATNRSSDASVPTLAKAYRAVQGNLALVQQDGATVDISFVNNNGAIYGHAHVTWDSTRNGFIGNGTVNTVCGSFDTRLWPAPVQEEIFLFNESVIRERWTNPERVNCDRRQVIQYFWRETLWYVPTK
jgi:S1-C subfamily serine protease